MLKFVSAIFLFCNILALSAQASLERVRSITARPDGRFNVVCVNGEREIATQEQIQAEDLCDTVVAPTPGATIIKGKDMQITVPSYNNGSVWTFGKNIWEGFVSFKFKAGNSVYDERKENQIWITDGLKRQWMIEWNKNYDFQRLVSPVTISAKANYFNPVITITELTYEITRTIPAVGGEFAGKSDQFYNLGDIGKDIPGVEMSFFIQAQFFRNFYSGDCDRILVVGADRTLELSRKNVGLKISKIIAPVKLQVSPTCQTSRLPQAENAENDVKISIPIIQFGSPI